MKRVAISILLMCFCFRLGAADLTNPNTALLVDPNLITLSSNSDFGHSVDIIDDWAVVSAPNHSDTYSSGVVLVFKKESGLWKHKHNLTQNNSYAFGNKIAITKNNLDYFIAVYDDINNEIFIYKYDSVNDDWGLGHTINSSAIHFALSGNKIAIFEFEEAPVIRTYDISGQTNISLGDIYANLSGGISCLALHGNKLAVGNPSGNGKITGYIYSNSSWSLQNTVNGSASEELGTSLDFDGVGGTLIAGAPGASKAYLIDTNSTPWSITNPTTGFTGTGNFGNKVSLDGTYALVGPGPNNSVSAYEINMGGTNNWVNVTSYNARTSEGFGDSIALNANHLLIGEPGNLENTSETGRAYLSNIYHKIFLTYVDGSLLKTNESSSELINGSNFTKTTAALYNGNAFVNWTDSAGTNVGSSTTLSITISRSGETYEANYATPVNLVFNSSAGGSVSQSSLTIGTGGDFSGITASADSGYSFVNWTDSAGSVVSTSSSLTLTNITAAETYTANFQRDEFTLNFVAGENGIIDLPELQTIEFGDSSSAVTATPNEGFMLINWTDSAGNEVSTEEILTIASVKKDETYTANFDVRISKLEFKATEGGQIAPLETQEITYNESSATVTATPLEGYQFTNWTDSSGDVITDNPALTIANVLIDQVYTANFAVAEYTLTIQYGTTDGVTSSSEITLTHGDPYSFSASPQANYKIQSIIINGTSVPEAAGSNSNFSYTIPSVTEDTLVSVTYDTLYDSSNLYRLYNTTGDYYYFTKSASEYATLGKIGEWIQYGIAGKIYNGAQITSGTAAVPYYVAKNDSNGEYFYSSTTADFPSGYTSQGTLGYIYDSSVSGSKKLYRLFNSSTDKYCWTSDSDEYSEMLVNGWEVSGTVMHMVKGPSPNLPSPTARYHAFNLFTLEHYYTTSQTEYNNLGMGWIKAGIDHYVYTNTFSTNALSSNAVYKFINPQSGFHYWTGDSNEVTVRTNAGWTSFGIDFHLISSRYLSSLPLTRLTGGTRYVWSVDPLDISSSETYGWTVDAIEGFAIPSTEYNTFLTASQYPTILHAPELAAMSPSPVPLVTLSTNYASSGLSISLTDNSSSSRKNANWGVQKGLPVYLVVTEEQDYEVIFAEQEEILEDVIILQEDGNVTHEVAIRTYFQSVNIMGIIKIN